MVDISDVVFDDDVEMTDPISDPFTTAPVDDDDHDQVGQSTFPELLEEYTGQARTFKDGVARAFGFATGDEFHAFVQGSSVKTDMALFTSVRQAHDAKYKTRQGVNNRPPLKQVEGTISSLRKNRPHMLDLSLSAMLEQPLQSDAETYAIAYNIFFSRWFVLPDSPFGNRGILPTFYVNRMNTLVKLLDKAKDGYSAMNRARDLHVSKKPRTLELAKIVHDAKRTPLTSPAERAAIRDEQRTAIAELFTAAHQLEAEARNAGIDTEAVEGTTNVPRTPTKARKKRSAEVLITVPTTHGKGVSTDDPSSRGKQKHVMIVPPEHDDDPSNPRKEWFYNGYVIGYDPSVIDELQAFTETDWECKDEDAEPTFNLSGGKPILKVDREPDHAVQSVLERLELEDAEDNAADAAIIAAGGVPPPRTDYQRNRVTMMDQLVKREARFKNLRKASGYDKQQAAGLTRKAAVDRSFLKSILQEKKYEALADTDKESKNPEEGAEGEREELVRPNNDVNDVDARMTIDQVNDMMDNTAFQPRDYRKALNIAKVARRKQPFVPGQRRNGFPNTWWQINGASEMLTRRFTAIQQRVKALTRLLRKKDPDAEENSRSGVEHGCCLADEVGIGKTQTWAAYRKMFLNERKLAIQTLYDSGDTAGLMAYPPPRPAVVLTQSHLVRQLAGQIASFSEDFDVFIYGGVSNDDPAGVRRITNHLTRNHGLFNHKNERNSQAIIVVSYQTMHSRHGPKANQRYLKAHGYSNKQAKLKKFGEIRDGENPGWRAPHDLEGLFEEAALDEAQNTKGLYSHSTYSIRSLHLDWISLITATPIPYRHRDFAGLLSFMQSPVDNEIARNRLKSSSTSAPHSSLLDPYEMEDGQLLRPDDARFQYTAVAFEHFACAPEFTLTSIGAVLARLWAKFVIRRDFSSTCVIDPEGTLHRIGSSMVDVRRHTFQLENDPQWQALHDSLIPEHLYSQLIPTQTQNDQQQMVLNGRSTRILGLGAVTPLLLLANDIHKAKIQPERDGVADRSGNPSGLDPFAEYEDDHKTESEEEDDEGEEDGRPNIEDRPRREKLVENPHLKQYRDLFLAKKDREFLVKLMTNIWDEARELEPPQHEKIFGPKHPRDCPQKLLAYIFIQSSVRLQTMFAAISDQLDIRDEKSLIFATNPFEQQLYVVLLRSFGIRAESVLASMKPHTKQHLVDRFQAPLTRWTSPGYYGTSENDVEVLVLSYYMNSGLNLHYHCHNLHAPSPPPSHAIWTQSCGRIVRFGQQFECVVFSYHVTRTYNTEQMAGLLKNALSSMAAMMCRQDAVGDDNYIAGRVSYDVLEHLQGYRGGLIDDRSPLYEAAAASGGVDTTLSKETKFLRLLNTSMGLTLNGYQAEAGYQFEPAAPLFQHYDSVEKHSKGSKKSNLAILVETSPTKNDTLPETKGSDEDVLDETIVPGISAGFQGELKRKIEAQQVKAAEAANKKPKTTKGKGKGKETEKKKKMKKEQEEDASGSEFGSDGNKSSSLSEVDNDFVLSDEDLEDVVSPTPSRKKKTPTKPRGGSAKPASTQGSTRGRTKKGAGPTRGGKASTGRKLRSRG